LKEERAVPRRLLVVVLLLLALVAPAASSEHRARVVRSSVHVDGKVRWRGRAVMSPLVWSSRRDALAFTARDRRGRTRLVVVIVDDELEPTAFSWPVPRHARPARAVTWLGEGRLGAGPSKLRPAMVVAYALDRSS